MTVKPLTSRTRVALAIARGVAAARGDRNLNATHVAVGILREIGNPAVAALWYAGMSEHLIRRMGLHLEHTLGDSPGSTSPRQVTVDLTPGEEEILRLGEIEADGFGDQYLGTEHILLAILQSDKSVARQFADNGVSLEKYREGLASTRRGDPPPQTKAG